MKRIEILVPPGGSGEHKTTITGAKGGSCVPLMDAINKVVGGTTIERTPTCEMLEQAPANASALAVGG